MFATALAISMVLISASLFVFAHKHDKIANENGVASEDIIAGGLTGLATLSLLFSVVLIAAIIIY